MYYEFIAIFIAPLISFLFLNKKKGNYLEKTLFYAGVMLFTNIIITSLLYITKGYTHLSFTIIFFVKYSITSLLISSLLILFKLNIKKIKKIIKKINLKNLFFSY